MSRRTMWSLMTTMSKWTTKERTKRTMGTMREASDPFRGVCSLFNFSYSDDEDVSWKIRRAAAKLLSALLGTRNELVIDFYKIAAPTLLTRFNEREESVRLEVFAAFEALLKQTITARAVELASKGRNKRKSEEMDNNGAMDDR